MPNIIVKNYEHINQSLPNWDTPKGKYIKNKDHYDREMKKAGMVTLDKISTRKEKEYVLSDKARGIINSASMIKDKKGNIKLSDRQIDAMKETGAIGKKIPEYIKMPPMNRKGGGFY